MAAIVNGKNISTAVKTCKNIYDVSVSTSAVRESKVLIVLSCIDLCVNIYNLVKECYAIAFQDISDDDKDDVKQKVTFLQKSLEKIEQTANETEIKLIHSQLKKAKKMLQELDNCSKMEWYKRIWWLSEQPKEKFNSIKDIINSVIQYVILIMTKLNVELEQNMSLEQAKTTSELEKMKSQLLGSLKKMTSEQNASIASVNKICIEQEKTRSELEKMKSELGNLKKICTEQDKTRSEFKKMKLELCNLKKEQIALIASFDKKMYIYYYITFIYVISAIFLLLWKI